MKHKVKTWIKRYGPAEIVCTITAILSASVTYAFTKNDILTALAGTWGENLGFYGVIGFRDIHASRNHHRIHGNQYTIVSFFKTIRDMIVEFGPAELLDSFVTRPLMMYIFPKLTGNVQTGILAGKIAADIIVYIPIIISYELQQFYKNKRSGKNTI